MYTWLREFLWGERAYLTYWYAFLLSFPFSWRTVIIPSLAGGNFNEYMDLSVYIGDILILSSLILIIKHNITIKSILAKVKLFHVEHSLITWFICFLLLSFFWSESKLLWMDGIGAIIRVITTLTIFVFSLKDKNCSTWNNLRVMLWILVFGLVFQSILSTSQYAYNQSLGLSFFGESILSEAQPGVAKIDQEFGKQIRGYGTFLHPNVLGGFLVVILLFLMTYWRMLKNKLFHVEQFFIWMSILLGFLALMISFSKSSIVSFILVLGVYLFHVEQNRIKKVFHVEHLVWLVTVIVLIIILFFLGGEQILKSINERLFLQSINWPVKEEFFIGKGVGQSVYNLNLHFPNLENWQLQPIHNVYLNILSDIGLIGLGFLWLITIKYIKIVPRGTKGIFYLPLAVLGIIAIFDHYLWDIYTGQIILALALGWAMIPLYLNIDKNINLFHIINKENNR